MCGRYVLRLRPSQVRQRLADQDMPVEEAPDDDNDQIRQTYNFAPGYHGLIYRANTSDRGGEADEDVRDHGGNEVEEDAGQPSPKKIKLSQSSQPANTDGRATHETKFKLQAAKWGLVPFWTKRPPDYGSQMRTINCRDDSLIENRGMWNTMKQRKRCIVIAEGFYEWKKENNGKIKTPHHIRRKDGELMCFAGLWDMVQYEGSDEKLYTYTIITTDSNKQLKFLHDRMPVILEPGSANMKQWLDPKNVGWSKELQGMLKPFNGELECYPVDKAVGKVGNNSPSFVVPVDSKENKNNIANFFGNQQAHAKRVATKSKIAEEPDEDAQRDADIRGSESDQRETTDQAEGTEDHAPLPKPKEESAHDLDRHIKRETAEVPDKALVEAADDLVEKSIKREINEVDDAGLLQAAEARSQKEPSVSPAKLSSPDKKGPPNSRRTRNALSNETVAKTPTKEGNKKITNFFQTK